MPLVCGGELGISRARGEGVGTDEDDGPPLAGGDPGERRLVAGRVGGCVVLAGDARLSTGHLPGFVNSVIVWRSVCWMDIRRGVRTKERGTWAQKKGDFGGRPWWGNN